VGILSDNVEGLMYDITKKFNVGPANFKSLGKELKLKCSWEMLCLIELLQVLTQRGQVTHL
jgi:ABC-2 type transport system ATP-binding protein